MLRYHSSAHISCLRRLFPSIQTIFKRTATFHQRSFATRASAFDTVNTSTRTQKTRQTPNSRTSKSFDGQKENESKQSFVFGKKREPSDNEKFKSYDPRMNSTNFKKYHPMNEFGSPMRYSLRDKVIESDKDRDRVLGVADRRRERNAKDTSESNHIYDEDDEIVSDGGGREVEERMKASRSEKQAGYDIKGTESVRNVKRESTDSPKYNHGLSGVGKTSTEKTKVRPVVMGEVLFGVHPTLMALTRGRRDIYRLYMRDKLATLDRPFVKALLTAAKEKQVEVQLCTKTLLNELSMSRPHQGVCLDAGKIDFEPLTSWPTVEESARPLLWIVLDAVQDPMNFGAIVRSAYYLGVDRILVVQRNSCSLTPVVSKASAGTIEISHIYAVPNLLDFLKEGANNGWTVFGTTSSPDGSTEKNMPLQDLTMTSNTIVVLGNEGRGLSDGILEACHRLVTVTSATDVDSSVDSLNVSVAAGIILHHLCRCRNG